MPKLLLTEADWAAALDRILKTRATRRPQPHAAPEMKGHKSMPKPKPRKQQETKP